ncbi:MAG: hypothetical protein AUJ55_04995 [Proteobacteria bacterium CG1_02_64_396]|nr:MAG: hypothetical protein AUJ55_04995 [Proteobacteria bacterium CG1_02_64_396]
MSGVAAYAYLDARVAGMSRHLTSPALLEQAIETHPNNIAPLLQQAGIAAGEGDQTGLPEGLSARWLAAILGEARTLIRALHGPDRELALFWVRQFEIGNLKTILRGRLSGLNRGAIAGQMVDLGPFATLPVDELLRTEDPAELLRLLEKTSFADIARQARRTLDEHQDLFEIDAAIDRRYYAGLWAKVTALPAAARQEVRPLLGREIDRINLVWLLRYRLTYRFPPAKTYFLLVPATYRLTSAHLLTLTQSETLPQVLKQLPPPFVTLLGGAGNITDVALLLERELRRFAFQTLHLRRFSLARVMAYLVLRELERRRLPTALKGRELGLTGETIRYAAGLEEGSYA